MQIEAALLKGGQPSPGGGAESIEANVVQLVEHDVANVEVMSSRLIIRSNIQGLWPPARGWVPPRPGTARDSRVLGCWMQIRMFSAG